MIVASAWDVVSALGTAVGGIAAAGGAIAAWRAAKASLATSEDAREALAVGIRPRPSYYFPDTLDTAGRRVFATVTNDSEWPAAELAFEIRLRDGHTVSACHERLGSSRGDVEEWQVIAEDPEPSPEKPLVERADYAVLRYSDDRGIARYEDRTTFLVQEVEEGGVSGTSWDMEQSERRIR